MNTFYLNSISDCIGILNKGRIIIIKLNHFDEQMKWGAETQAKIVIGVYAFVIIFFIVVIVIAVVVIAIWYERKKEKKIKPLNETVSP